MSSLAAGLLAFGVILLVELPDKTLVASLVLSTRYRPRPVLIGVAARVRRAVRDRGDRRRHASPCCPAARSRPWSRCCSPSAPCCSSRNRWRAADDVELAEARETASFGRIVATSFGVLFAAEWGDASQIATAGLVARHRGLAHAVATGVGAWLALVAVAALAVLAGRLVRAAGAAAAGAPGGRRPVRRLRRAGRGRQRVTS